MYAIRSYYGAEEQHVDLLAAGDALALGRQDGDAVGPYHGAQDAGVLVAGARGDQPRFGRPDLHPQKMDPPRLLLRRLAQGRPDRRPDHGNERSGAGLDLLTSYNFV